MDQATFTIRDWVSKLREKGMLILVVCQTKQQAHALDERLGECSQALVTGELRGMSRSVKDEILEGTLSKWVSAKPVLVGTTGVITGYDSAKLAVVIGVGALHGMNDLMQFLGRPARTEEFTVESPGHAVLMWSRDALPKHIYSPESTSPAERLLYSDRQALIDLYKTKGCIKFHLASYFDEYRFTCSNEHTAACGNCEADEVVSILVPETEGPKNVHIGSGLFMVINFVQKLLSIAQVPTLLCLPHLRKPLDQIL